MDGVSSDIRSVRFDLKGKSAIVTGAGSGINLCFAALLLSHGCNVLIADLSLRPEAKSLLVTYPYNLSPPFLTPRAIFHPTDVSSWPALSSAFAAALTAFGTIDLVCPGAGVYDPLWSNFWHPPDTPGSTSRDALDGGRYASLDINLTHPIRLTQLAIAHFLNPPSGSDIAPASPTNPKRVVITSSVAGQVPNFPTPLYVAAKHGINGFIRSLGRLEARCGIRVNGVAPGLIKTPLWTEDKEKLTYVDPERDEWATPEEVAEAMIRCVIGEETDRGGATVGGGGILEVLKGRTRVVGSLNDPGPSGPASGASNMEEQYEKVFQTLGSDAWGAVE